MGPTTAILTWCTWRSLGMQCVLLTWYTCSGFEAVRSADGYLLHAKG